MKDKLQTLVKEFTTLKNKVLAKLQAKDRAITEKDQVLNESTRKLETTLKENSENEKVLETLLKEFQELSKALE